MKLTPRQQKAINKIVDYISIAIIVLFACIDWDKTFDMLGL